MLEDAFSVNFDCLISGSSTFSLGLLNICKLPAFHFLGAALLECGVDYKDPICYIYLISFNFKSISYTLLDTL